MGSTATVKRFFVLRIDSYEGDDTFLHCGDETQDYLYAIAAIDALGRAEIIDSSYRTLEEVYEAWPAVRPEG